MVEPPQFGNSGATSSNADLARANVYSVSQGTGESSLPPVSPRTSIEIDSEVANLLVWLAEQQGITPELALKKAVATAAYLHDVIHRQGGKLLVHRKDNTVGEIVFK